jgi:endogenous inhibitor of DNA gyrase (YacG/DUF329 family)
MTFRPASGTNLIFHSGMERSIQVRCTTCKKTGDWFAGRFGPFCSQRCRLIDLGKWFGEENVISDPLRSEHLEPFAELPRGQNLDETEP